MGSPSFIPLSQLQQTAGQVPVNPEQNPVSPKQISPDFIPLTQLQSSTQQGPSTSGFISQDELQATPPEVSDPNEGTLGKVWRVASTPLLDLHRQGAGPIETGVETFASGLTSPLSIALAIGTAGLGSLAEGAGATALESFSPEIATAIKPSAAFASKALNLGFTGSQIVDVAKNVPQISSAIQAGDTDRAIELLTETALNAGAAGMSAAHLTNGLRSEPFSFEGDKQSIGAYQAAVEKGNLAARNFELSNRELIKNKPLDQAALLYHEASGNPATLEQWRQDILSSKEVSDATKGRFDSVLKLAQNLPDNVKALSDQLRTDYTTDWQRGQSLGIFDPEGAQRQNYAGRHEYQPDDITESSIRPGVAGTKNPAFAKARSFETLVEAIKQGFEPAEQGLATARSKYIRQFAVSEGLRNAEQKLQETTATKDSAPIGINPAKVRTISGQYLDQYPTRVFHGTSADVADVHGLRPEEFGVPGRLGQGAYFSLSPDIASKYAGGPVSASGGRVVAGELSDGVKLLDADAALPKKLQTVLKVGPDTNYGEIIREAITNREDISEIQKAVAKAGYDGVRSEDVHGAPGIMMFGQDVTGRPLSDVIEPTVPTDERAMGDKAKSVRAIPVPVGADLDMLANSGRLIIGPNGKRYIDVSDYKQGPDKFNLFRVKQGLFDEEGERVPVFERQNLLIHPDFHEPVMRAFQDESWFRKNVFANALLKGSTQAKKSLLSLSPFHLLTEAERGLQMGLSPAEVVKPPLIDPEGLAMTQGTKHGLTLLGDTPGRNNFAEGVGQNAALLHKIPVLGSILHAAEDKLFSDYIPRLKAITFEKLSESLQKQHPDWSDAQVYTTAAHLSNSAFGGLNWKMLGKSLTGQDFLRLTMLAPDFTGSQYYFAKAGFQPGGSQVWQSFARIAAYNLLVAQTLNMLNTGKVRMDHPFSVVSEDGKNIYSVRTMPEDIAKALSDPRSFAYNRLNPITTKPVVEFLSGKDQQGRNATYGQQLTDLLKNVVPMPAQSIGAEDPAGQFMRSFGVARTPSRSAAETLAIQKASARGSQGAIPLEQLQQHQMLHDLTDKLRDGQATNQQVVQALRDGTISRLQAERVIKESRMTPLSARVQNLPLADSLDVYEIATAQEKAQLQLLLMKKVEQFGKTQANRTPQANAFIAQRIRKTLGLHLGVPTHRFDTATGTIQQIQ
jgi:hypothetical protein